MTSLPARLTVVTLGVRHLPAMRAFYMALGFPKTAEAGDGFTAFWASGLVLALFPIDQLAEEAGAKVPSGGEWNGFTLAINVESREEVDLAYAVAIEAGAVAIAEPIDRDWGGRSGYFADPEGNRWEIAWAPGAKFDAQGRITGFGD